MIRVNALVFLFIVQFLLMFLGIAIFLFIRHKKLSVKAVIAQGEIRRLENDLENSKLNVSELLPLQNILKDLQQKHEESNVINAKMKEMIDFLAPEAERSKEFQQLLAEVEKNRKELDTCLGTLQKENEALNEQMESSEKKLRNLSGRLEDSVSKEEYQNVLSEKKSLELKVERMKKDLDQKTSDLERLEKNFIYLEKEYNALYKNVKGEEP
ncbi:MAG: hypothetical protein C4560_07775 [Nitrospiraceae bacterium]|nr:MAG: hypothetical protein C4560_07775 [Nitrospiraceae bacterium]